MEKKTPIDLTYEVEAFLKQTGMSASAFGTASIGIKHLVTRLRSGCDVNTRTAQKVRDFMRDFEKKNVA